MEKTDIDPDTLNRPDWNSLLANYSAHDIGEAYLKGRIEEMGLLTENWGIDMRHNDDELIFDNKMDLRVWKPLDGQSRAPNPTNLSSETRLYEVPTDPALFEAAEAELESSVDLSDDQWDTEQWELRALVDIKTKRSSSWMGKFNLRHLAHYAEHADSTSAPTFVYFTVVNSDTESVGDEQFIVPIRGNWEYEALVDHYDRDCDYQLSGEELHEIATMSPVVTNTFRAPDGNMVVETDKSERYDMDFARETLRG